MEVGEGCTQRLDSTLIADIYETDRSLQAELSAIIS
jgi:hypothetical protein